MISVEIPLMLFAEGRPQRMTLMPHSVPASAVLSVDIQPPIA